MTIAGMNPISMIENEPVLMVMQSASAVPVQVLKVPVASSDEHRHTIPDAIAMRLDGA